MRNNPFPFGLFLFAYGVFGADGVKSVSVSVMVGDSVTLHTGDTKTQRVLELVWKIQGENKFMAEIDKEINKLSVPGNEEEPFRGRLKLDNLTDSLTITNLKTADSRVYELQIKTTKETKSKIFNVDVSGRFEFNRGNASLLIRTSGSSHQSSDHHVITVSEDEVQMVPKSTDDAISHTLHSSLKHIDSSNGNYVRLLFIDYSSAFNTVVPIKLASKLMDLGLNSSLCDWILDFLTGRP
ncbi:uncharacterized protein LOC113078162 [Carassius auratus]|uniref:Uncharacterized protein LOC113078162 n=1 Tax=Carassius auratus TaxID=7957 RepID=A0A6P6NCM1_CARAU|nr:uncharacterized protein LOC113078162 [Carassius auratus]